MKKYGLIGYPLTHSFSKKYFTEKFIREGIRDCSYELYPISSIDELEDLIKQNPDLQGLNVTLPYKRSVLHYLSDTNKIPNGLRACNCIKIKDGKRSGYNTDIAAFEQSLVSRLKNYHTNAL